MTRPSSRDEVDVEVADCVRGAPVRRRGRAAPVARRDVGERQALLDRSFGRMRAPIQRARVALTCSSVPSAPTEARPMGAVSNCASCTSTPARRVSFAAGGPAVTSLRAPEHEPGARRRRRPSRRVDGDAHVRPVRARGSAVRVMENSSVALSPRSAARVSRKSAALACGSPAKSCWSAVGRRPHRGRRCVERGVGIDRLAAPGGDHHAVPSPSAAAVTTSASGARFVRRYAHGAPLAALFAPKSLKRIDIVEQVAIDAKRKLVLVRRDDVEHLVMTGGPADIVIESGIGAPRTAAKRARRRRCRCGRARASGRRSLGCGGIRRLGKFLRGDP